MAVIGITLALASISLVFYRIQAASIFSRIWPSFRRLDKDRSKMQDEDARQNDSDDSDGPTTNKNLTSSSDRVMEPQETLKSTSSPKTKTKTNPETMSNSTTDRSGAAPKPESPGAHKAPTSPSKSQSAAADARLMPPPARPAGTSSKPTPPQSSTTLRVPSTGPRLGSGPPNGAPPSSTQPSSTLAPTCSTLPAAARKKVLLAPGHSPLDWAQLTRTAPAAKLSGVPAPRRVTPAELARANGRRGAPAWSAYRGRVYNIGAYLPYHPGGPGELLRAAGKDGQRLFEEMHSWVNWENMLGTCLVGFLVEAEGEEDMEGLD